MGDLTPRICVSAIAAPNDTLRRAARDEVEQDDPLRQLTQREAVALSSSRSCSSNRQKSDTSTQRGRSSSLMPGK
jgi:hypothetical protein